MQLRGWEFEASLGDVRPWQRESGRHEFVVSFVSHFETDSYHVTKVAFEVVIRTSASS